MENWWKGEVGFVWGGSVVVCEDKGGKTGEGISEDILFGFSDRLSGL